MKATDADDIAESHHVVQSPGSDELGPLPEKYHKASPNTTPHTTPFQPRLDSKGLPARDVAVLPGRWRRIVDARQGAETKERRVDSCVQLSQGLDATCSFQRVVEQPCNVLSEGAGTLPGAAHKDPKTGDVMRGPGITDWTFAVALDGNEGRHCDPWGPGEPKVHVQSKRGYRNQATVRQGQGIEEALSKIGAEAGMRQERPGGEGYCPAGEAAFRANEACLDSFAVCAERPKSTAIDASMTAAQRRNHRRARRRAKGHSEPCDVADGLGGCLVLVRDDCRFHDNPAVHHAATKHPWSVLLYVHDTCDPSPLPVRGAALYWRYMSLRRFESAVQNRNGRLIFRKGAYIDQVLDVLLSSQATAVYFNRQLEPWYRARDLDLERKVSSLGFHVQSFKGLVLQREPWDVHTARPPPHLCTKYQGSPTRASEENDDADDSYFWPLHAFASDTAVEPPLPTVQDLGTIPYNVQVESLTLASLEYGRCAGKGMPPSTSMPQYNEKREKSIRQGTLNRDAENDWAFEMRRFWNFGEDGAVAQLESFLVHAVAGRYQPPERYRADMPWTALLSPYLRFGDLSPRYVYARAKEVLTFTQWKPLVRRLFWRDGAYAQLYRWPNSPETSIRQQYETEVWNGTQEMLLCWQRGRTGFPLIDAAMRQLWKVGWMPNYLRHVTAQFLIEYLDISWKQGLHWYDYTLVDSDVAINAMMWQMGGHSGLGAWNFVMHPVFAGKKVDPEGHYVRQWLPELRGLPVEYIHCPWEAPCSLMLSANVHLLATYSERIIDDLVRARKAHGRNVIAVRRRFPELVQPDGHEILEVAGQQLVVRVRDDLKDNSMEISLEMTPDDAHSAQRRRLTTKGIHNELLFDEVKKHEAFNML